MPNPARPKQARHAIQARPVPVTIRGADDPTPDKPATFTLAAYTGEPMSIYPWDQPVVVDLDTVDASGLPFPALYDHVPDEGFIVGQVETVAVEGGRLVATGRFTPTDDPQSYSRKVLARAKAGYQWQASIGGDPATVEDVRAGESVQLNGRTYQGPVTVARGVVLREISFVVLGGDRLTSAVVARNLNAKRIKGGGMKPTFEEYVASLGFSAAELDETQAANMKLQYEAEYPGGAGDAEEGDVAAEVIDEDEIAAMDDEDDLAAAGELVEDEIAAIDDEEEEKGKLPTNARAKRNALKARLRQIEKRKRVVARTKRTTVAGKRVGLKAGVAAERGRVAAITRICAENRNPKVKAKGKKVPLSQYAIAAGWSVDRVKSEAVKMLRAKRPKGPTPNGHRPQPKDASVQALQGAMLLRCGGRLDHKAYRTLQARGMSVPEFLKRDINDAERNRYMEAAHRYADMSLVDVARESLRLAGRQAPHGRSEMIQAAFSGGNLSSIFTSNVNALLLASYMEAGDTTEAWTTTQDVADFKTQERIRVDVGPGLDPLPRGGEADHAKYGDTVESYRVSRFAKQFVIDEQDIIDDTFGALSDTPQRLGAAAARLRPDLVYSILLSNPQLNATGRAIFNGTEGNTTAAAPLASETLRAAIQKMMTVREGEVNLNLTPTHLIVPPDLLMTAKELVASQTILIAGDTDRDRGSANVIADMNLTIVADARLSNGATDPATKVPNAGSATTWYLATTQAQTIEVGYLRGTGRTPRVRPFTLDRGKYGVGWDVSLDIGAKALDWRGLQRQTG